MREAFEQAIEEDPDERSNYAAFGDWLSERGDPQGEFIAVQLTLEDPACRGNHRQDLEVRERELLTAHQEEWLGPLAPFLAPGGMSPDVAEDLATMGSPPCLFVRGFLHTLHVGVLTVPLARALRDAPQTRFLRHLVIEGLLDEEEHEGTAPGDNLPADLDPDAAAGIYPLLGRDSFPCLRHLRIGNEVEMDPHWPDRSIAHYVYVQAPLAPLLSKMPRLEELHLLCKDYDVAPIFSLPTLTRLRVLRLYHLGQEGADREARDPYAYPLEVLAGNKAFGNLTHLLFHPHCEEVMSRLPSQSGGHLSFLPIEQVQALLGSPHLTNLTHLQLRLSDMGDAGCRALVESGILRRLKWLDLRYGCIGDGGARILAACADLMNLEHLDLGRNALTEEGIAVLAATGVRLRAEDQLTTEELREGHYLYEGDGE
jgi:uncharacterized protein (TIGR02996 family)